MKLKTITAILKASKHLYTYTAPISVIPEGEETDITEQRERWIGDGAAMYKLDERIAFTTAEQWLILLDVPEDKRNYWHYDDKALPDGICYDDTDETEESIEILPFTVGWRDMIFRFFTLNNRIITVNEEYLKPFWGVNEENVLFTWHSNRSDINGYIAVKTGLILQAVIIPYFLEKTLFDSDTENGQGELIEKMNEVGKGLSIQKQQWELSHAHNERKNK